MNNRYKQRSSLIWRDLAPPPGFARGGASKQTVSEDMASVHDITDSAQEGGIHSLVKQDENAALLNYEQRIKAGFDGIEAALRKINTHSGRKGAASRMRQVGRTELGFDLPAHLMEGRGNRGVNIAPLYGYSVLRQFQQFSTEFFQDDPLNGRGDQAFMNRLLDCGFHAVGIAPCSDGRLAHVISYVLRLPYGMVRRKSHAGSLFDISESVRNWVFTEHRRYREAQPNPADQPTRYLKVAVYHFSKSDPEHQGCAAHGSDDHKAAQAALSRLDDFEEAISNRFCCQASTARLLIGLNTDDDTIRVHVPDSDGATALDRYLDSGELFELTCGMTADDSRAFIARRIEHLVNRTGASMPDKGMASLINWWVENNFSQIDYVRRFYWGRYQDIGHAERFIGVGNGFEEVQLRNLCYYAFAETLEEGADDIGVGLKIFSGLNFERNLPVPIVIRCEYDGHVPGSKTRAEKRALRIENELHERYADVSAKGLMVTMRTLRDGCGYQAPEFAEPVIGGLTELKEAAE